MALCAGDTCSAACSFVRAAHWGLIYYVAHYTGATRPRMLRVVLGFVSCVVSYDLWFYVAHRLLHTPLLYARYHSQHHQHKRPTYRETFVASTVENCVSGLGILVPLLCCPTVSIPAFAAAYLYCFVRGVLRHDSRASWLVGDHHLVHHMEPATNFSSYYVDAIFSTCSQSSTRPRC